MAPPPTKLPGLVGSFIRKRRETTGLSQRALGQLFTPPVTTQFISNVERGVTPLPPSHVPVLTQALGIAPAEIMGLLEREYALRLSGRLNGSAQDPPLTSPSDSPHSPAQDFEFLKKVCEAFHRADPITRQTFAAACENLLQNTLSSSPPLSGLSSGPKKE